MIPFPTLSSEFAQLEPASQPNSSRTPKEAQTEASLPPQRSNTQTSLKPRAQAIVERVLARLPELAKSASAESFAATEPMPIEQTLSKEPLSAAKTHSREKPSTREEYSVEKPIVQRTDNGGIKLILKDTGGMTPDTVVALQGYPRVLQRIKLAWGDQEMFQTVMEQLQITEAERLNSNNPGGHFGRQGFSVQVMSEILELTDTHNRLFGLPPTVTDTIEFQSKQGLTSPKTGPSKAYKGW